MIFGKYLPIVTKFHVTHNLISAKQETVSIPLS